MELLALYKCHHLFLGILPEKRCRCAVITSMYVIVMGQRCKEPISITLQSLSQSQLESRTTFLLCIPEVLRWLQRR